MNRLQLREWEGTSVDLGAAEVTALALSDAFDVRPDRVAPGRWRVTASRHVGVVQIGGALEIRVEPKVGVRRLVELLSLSRERIRWDPTATPGLGESPDLVGLIAAALTARVNDLAARGLLHGYRRFDEALPTVKGRIRVGAQMSRRAGLPLPVELRYDRLTPDIVENQLLAGAVRQLLGLPSVAASVRTGLRRLRDVFADVTPAPPSAHPALPGPTRLNGHYGAALDLAVVVLQGCSLDETVGLRAGTGFLIDMDKVFEDVVTVGLGQLLGPRDLLVAGQVSVFLDRDRRLSIRPDIVISNRAGAVIGVLDVKYKLPTERDVAVADVNQAVVYAQRFGLDRVHLVYAERPPWPELVVNGVTVHLDWVDLRDEQPSLQRIALGFSSLAPQHAPAGA